MKVLFYIERFWPIVGGAERSAERLAEALIQRDIDITILTRQWNGMEKKDWMAGAEINRISTGGTKDRLGSIMFFINSWLLMKKAQKTYDVLHMHGINIFSGLLAKAFKPKKSIIKTTTEQDVENVANFKPFGKWFLKQLNNIDYFICTSKAQEDEVKKYLPDVKTVIIPNGIDIKIWKR